MGITYRKDKGEPLVYQEMDDNFEYLDENKANKDEPDFTDMPTINGVPIIESGSNDDGEWVRYADGTQICYISKNVSITINNSYGSLYHDSVYYVFPRSFQSTPVGFPGRGNYSTGAAWMAINRIDTSSIRVRILDVLSRDSSTELIQAGAIGRWK